MLGPGGLGGGVERKKVNAYCKKRKRKGELMRKMRQDLANADSRSQQENESDVEEEV